MTGASAHGRVMPSVPFGESIVLYWESSEIKTMSLRLGGVEVEDTFYEAFPMIYSRLLVTADTEGLARTAARAATGFGVSIIMSPAEAGVEGPGVPEDRTPDGRPGVHAQFWQIRRPDLKAQLVSRITQCILPCPTTNVFDGAPEARRKIKVGSTVRLYGDGFERRGELGGREGWRIPAMDGEAFVEDTFGVMSGVAGGNFIIMGRARDAVLRAAEEAVAAIGRAEGTVLTFPGGICRSGSKVGAVTYKKLRATTNHPFCPTLRDRIPEQTRVPKEVNSILEMVINGVSFDAVNSAVEAGIRAAAEVPGVVRITAVNFGGKLGPYKGYLRELLGL